MIEPSLQIGGGNWANKSDKLLGYHKDGAKFYADELTFSRNSLASYTDANGLIQSMPYNLLTYSEQFDNAGWTKIAGVTSNVTTAPNGTTTADKINEAAVNDYQNIFQGVTQNAAQYTYSIYLKKAQNDRCVLFAGSSQALLWVDMTNWTSFAQSNVNSYSIDAVGDGWYRVAFSYTNTTIGNHQTGINLVQIGSTNTVTYLGSTSNGAFIYGAQLNQGSTALPYFATTTRLNLARVDYKDNVNGSLLLESQRTNLVTYSEDFSNAAWVKLNGSVTANNGVSPDGTSNADSFIPNTTSGIHALRSNILNQSATASHSWFLKANGYSKIAVRESELVGNYATFNLTTGTVISTNQTANIENYGNGWYRCTLVDTTIGTFAQTSVVVLPDSYTSGDPIVVNWSGDGIKGVFAWGASVEIGNYKSSYIKSEGAATTRLADSCSKTGISDKIGQTEGTLFVEANRINKSVNWNFLITLQNQATISFIELLIDSNNTLIAQVLTNNANYQTIISPALTNGVKKIALAYKSGDLVLYVNGVQIGINTSVTIPALNELTLGHSPRLSPTQYADGIAQAQLYKTRLSNAELATLTTL